MATNVMRVPVRGSGSSMPEYGARTKTAIAGSGASARLDDGAAGIAFSGNWKERDWKDLYNFGQAVEKAGIAGHQMYMDYQQTKAKEAYNKYQQEAMQEKARLNDLKGSNAIGEHGVQAQLSKWQESARQRLLKDLGEPAQILFGKMADKEDASLDAWGISKSSHEYTNYQNSVDEGRVMTAQQQAMADPSKLAESMGVIQATYKDMGRRNGWDTEYTKAKFEQIQQKTVSDMISTAIEGEQMGQARSLLGQYGGLLGAARKGIEAKYQAKARALQSRAETQAEKGRTQIAIGMAQELVAQGANAEGAQAYIAANTSDPVTAYKAQQAYVSLVSMNERMEKLAKEEEDKATFNQSLEIIQAKDATPAQMSAAIMEAPAQYQGKLQAIANKRLGGENFLSDKVKLREMQADIVAGTYDTGGMNKLREDYGPYISDAELARAGSILEQRKEKAAQAALKPIFFNRLREWNDTLKDIADDSGETVAATKKAIWEDFSEKCFELGIHSPREQMEYLETYMRERSLKKEGVFFDTKDQKEPTFKALQLVNDKDSGWSFNIPEQYLPSIDASLKAGNIPLTDENRQIAYRYLVERGEL